MQARSAHACHGQADKTIALQEGITVEETNVNNRIAVKAKEFGTTTKTLQTELTEGGGIGQLRDMLLAESTLDIYWR